MKQKQKKLTEFTVRKAMSNETHAKIIETEDNAEDYFKTYKEVINNVESNTPQIASARRTNTMSMKKLGQSVSIPPNTAHDIVSCPNYML